MATSTSNAVQGPTHTSGIYGDMSIDGPEIGTLVVVFDRAKNLPNRRTMGKQDPYCAARLGKEAKKTETDKRGGQTPRWDQELRFTVHDSPDYHNVKVSIFNDDKKTDLIGEAWINLDDVLKKGGGQADGWHGLNFKGRYAGEVRVELTFYDSRPRGTKREKKEPNKDILPEVADAQAPTQNGPRPLPTVKRRPVPSEATASPKQPSDSPHSNSLPMPHAAPRSYHTPPRPVTGPLPSEYGELPQPSFTQPDAYSRPLPMPSLAPAPVAIRNEASSAPVRYNVPHEDDPVYYELSAEAESDDRQEYQDYDSRDDDYYYQHEPGHMADYAEAHYQQPLEALPPRRHSSNSHLQPTPPKHDRVQALTSSPPFHSSPQSMPYAQRSEQYHTPDYNNDYYGRPRQPSDSSSPHPLDGFRPQSFPNQSTYSRPSPNSGHPGITSGRQLPPLPPSHSNSAPAVPQLYNSSAPLPPQPPIEQRRQPLRLSIAADDLPSRGCEPEHQRRYEDEYGPYSAHVSSSPYGYPDHRRPHRQNSADAILYQPEIDDSGYYYDYSNGAAQPHDRAVQRRDNPTGRQSMGLYQPVVERNLPPVTPNQGYHRHPHSHVATPASSPIPYPPHYSRARGHTPQQSLPNIKPGSVTPAEQLDYQMPNGRKPITTPVSTKTTSSSFYSPDSFNALNPNLQKSAFLTSDSKEPSPMYASQKSNGETTPEPVKPNDPIIGSDGRVKDPSDHLPISSYAPEPEIKGTANRPLSMGSTRNRFGPREAPSPTPASRPSGNNLGSSPAANVSFNSSRNSHSSILRKRSSALGLQSGPLSPSSSNTLNSNFASPYPPPVPGKIPISPKIEDYEPGGNMTALSDELAGIDIGPTSNAPKKLKKSRFIMS